MANKHEYPLGLKVFLPDHRAINKQKPAELENFELCQPKPEKIGMYGTLTGYEMVKFMGREMEVPVFTLEDGTVIAGYECWWEPVKDQTES